MNRITHIAELRNIVIEARTQGKSIGFVPTMGFLHQGHLALMEKARRENDLLIASVFVNPTQFGPNEDFEAYPRDEQKDLQLMAQVGVDAAFFPSAEEMYPSGYATYAEVHGSLTQGLCGASREGHFKGVTTVVLKLFNIVQPHRAYFGQKDAQQVAVLQRMVQDFNIPVEIVPCPIVREEDGLALSSRNTYLSESERKEALVLNRSLSAAEEMVQSGERRSAAIYACINHMISAMPSCKKDYIEIVDADSLVPVEQLAGRVLIALAVKVGRTRLIDNRVLEVGHVG